MSSIRPWGVLQTLNESKNYLVKSITVTPGKQCSLHLHRRLQEHWIFTEGRGKATIGNESTDVEPGVHIHVPANLPHRIANTGSEPLKYIEVIIGHQPFDNDLEKLELTYDVPISKGS